ncbi:MAG TPA: SDR family oxidoreductase [Candidatus Binataceae bacterium]|nr:SDR family oxidoreductase [Candidatus Binataceae bacterium]
MATGAAFDLTGKVAAVTGGNTGIGKAIALGLARAGASVAILARNEDRNAATLQELQSVGRPAAALKIDLSQRQALQPALSEVERQLGPLNILVNNAAFAILKGLLDHTEEDWDSVLATDLTACFLLSKYAAQSMIRQGRGGKIINVASIAGFKGTGVFPSYAVSKGGLLQLTRCLAIELAPHRIQVNSLAPGWTTTDMTAWIRTEPQYAELYKEMVTRTPAGRFAEPEETAGAAVFLASSASDFMTGADLIVDGGFFIR